MGQLRIGTQRSLDAVPESHMTIWYEIKLKCVFGQEELTFLGHVEGIKPDLEKARVINDMMLRKNKVELQLFWGMINYLV